MYIMTLMRWSDVAMGDAMGDRNPQTAVVLRETMGDRNPQTAVVLRETLDEIKQLVVKMVNEQWDPTDDDNSIIVNTYEEAVEFLKSATESPELDIREIQVGGDWENLTRDVLDDKTAEEVRIAELEAKVRELMGLLQGGR